MGLQATTPALTYARGQYIQQGRSHIFDKVADMIYYTCLRSAGTIYFVDEENGDDDNSGLTAGAAFATVANAADECDDNYDDDALTYTFVLPGNYSEDDILFAGHGWQLCGLGAAAGRDSGVHVVAPDDASAYGVIAYASANCSVENMCFEINGSAQPVLYLVAFDNCVVKDCKFYSDDTPTNVCVVEAHDIRNSVLEHNWFFGGLTYGWYSITGADKYLIETHIRDNIFSKSSVGGFGSGAKGIYVHADIVGYGTVIEHNKVLMGEVAGSPIGIDDNCGTGDGILIINNYVAVPASKTAIETANGISIGNHTDAGGTTTDPNPAP